MKILSKFIGWAVLTLLFLVFSQAGYSQPVILLSSTDDYHQVLTCYNSTVFDVLFNDTMIHCNRNEISLTILNSSKTGAANSVDANKNIVYIPVIGFSGYDTLEYKVVCHDTIYTAKVFITVVKCPDNLIETDCYDTSSVINWNYKLLMMSPITDIVCSYSIPLVGDIDNDGKTEIIAPAYATGSNWTTNAIYIFEIDGNAITRQQKLNIPYINLVNNSYSIANVDGGYYAALFIATAVTGNAANDQRQLIKYVYNGTQYVESWRRTYSTLNTRQTPQPMIADFNNDGIPEVLVYDKVFNACTGDLLVDAGYLSDATKGFGIGGHLTATTPNVMSSMMAIADIDGDGIPEVIGGNSVYKVNITNQSGTAGNSFTLYKQASTIGRPEVKDGTTAVADINGDGLLDVIVTAPLTSTTAALYVWDPRTCEILNANIINNLQPATNHGISAAFIGDIDGDGKPEICLTARNTICAYDYNITTKQLTQKWNRATTDDSGATTMVLFDFDLDGQNELVYRDQTNLRIINGVDGTDKISNIIYCYSSTANEYPVVVDVNNDGAAEIVVTGGTSSAETTARVMIFSSQTPQDKWAPARKAWNQFAYNVVNVNEDLTIPQYQMNPATFFPNGKQPFNAYLQQQTLLNQNGNPFYLKPNIVWAKKPEATLVGDLVTFTGCITNTGSIALQSPIYVTFYKNDTIAANIIALDSIQEKGILDSTLCFTITINISTHTPITSIWISINDLNGNYPYQKQCMVDGRREIILRNKKATDDYLQVVTCDSSMVVDVLANDTMINSPRNDIKLTITKSSQAGAATTINSNNNIVYTPLAGFIGRDTLKYNANYNDTIYTATIFITVDSCLNITICQDDSYDFYGQILTQAGKYKKVFQSIYGCDSTVILNLYVANKNTILIFDTICQEDTYQKNGFNESVSGTYEQHLQNRYGCDSLVTLNLTVNPIPDIEIIAITDNFCAQDFVVLQLITNGDSFLWNTESTENPITITKPGVYSVTVFLNDCEKTASYIVEECPCYMWLPNAFTPNGDGINEIFKPEISCSESLKDYKMDIYNRWGNLIFQSFDYAVGWNGTNDKGKDCSPGVYYCVIEYTNPKNERVLKNTSITLLR